MRRVLIILLMIPLAAYADEEPLFSLEIANNNLFLCIHETPRDIASITIVLKGGRRFRVNPAEGKSCGSVVYIDGKMAYQVKRKGIKHLLYKDHEGKTSKVDVTSKQNQHLLSSLP